MASIVLGIGCAHAPQLHTPASGRLDFHSEFDSMYSEAVKPAQPQKF